MARNMKAGARQAKGALRNAADILWPPRSLISGQRGVAAGPVSASEFGQLNFLTGALCHACGAPLDFDMGEEAVCAACLARPPAWDRARAALIYDDGSRRAILDLKRSGRRDGLKTLAGWMLQVGRPLVEQADLIVPVPLHYRRLVSRGYNQAGWLAQTIGRQTHMPVRIDALKRIRATPRQGGLSARGRHRNVAGAFAVRARAAPRIMGRRIILIDDVLTTGATLGACARTLKVAGASNVDALVLARVVRPQDVTI